MAKLLELSNPFFKRKFVFNKHCYCKQYWKEQGNSFKAKITTEDHRGTTEKDTVVLGPHVEIIGERYIRSEFSDRISVGLPNHQKTGGLWDEPVEHISV